MEVKYFPFQPHCFAFGGFDLQMLNTLEAVRNAGVNAEKLDVWSRDADFEILHIWGMGPSNFDVIDWARKAGKKVVATVLLPYHDTLRSLLGYFYRWTLGEGRHLISHLKAADRVVVLNEGQSRVLQRFYGVAKERICIIPNIIESAYFEPPEFDFKAHYSIEDFVLCTGNISYRKNQLNLARACVDMNQNLVLIGNVLDGAESYGQELEKLIRDNPRILWIRELPKASGALIGAYHECRVFALPSRNETQPISALEAAAMKKPLVLMDRAYARQQFYKGAFLCHSSSPADIRRALEKALGKKEEGETGPDLTACTAAEVGARYKECYHQISK